MKKTWWFFLAATTCVAVLTFPWDLQNHPHWQKVAWVPFLTGIVRPPDLLGNAALYFPFGVLHAGRVAEPACRRGHGPVDAACRHQSIGAGLESRAVPVSDRRRDERSRECRRGADPLMTGRRAPY
jgi:hypothetical protein